MVLGKAKLFPREHNVYRSFRGRTATKSVTRRKQKHRNMRFPDHSNQNVHGLSSRFSHKRPYLLIITLWFVWPRPETLYNQGLWLSYSGSG